MKRILLLLTMWLFLSNMLSAQTSTWPTGSGTSSDPYLIATLGNLYWLSQNSTYWDKYYKVTANIDASSTSSWNGGQGFSPIGTFAQKFTGTFDGGGYCISGLYIYQSTLLYTGLFGYAQGASFKSLGLANVNITSGTGGAGSTGALCGYGVDIYQLSNCYSTGSVKGPADSQQVGGLMGTLMDNTTSTNFNYCYSTCNVLGGNGGVDAKVGGLIGSASANPPYKINFLDCYTTGNITSNSASGDVGGLSSGNQYVRTYAYNCYSAGKLTGPNPLAVSSNIVSGYTSYYNSQLNPTANTFTATGLTTSSLQSQSSFSGFDFSIVWAIDASYNGGYPYLRNTPLVSPAPTISSFSPSSAGNATTVTIYGSGFAGISGVSFGGTAATSFTVVDASTITAVVSTGTSGNVTVTNAGGTATASGFTWVPAPTISSFTPTTGGTGTTVTITGTNFTGVTAVSFGGTAATSYSVNSSTSITATVGGGSSGNVSVTAGGGTANSSGFTWVASPVISSFSPTSSGNGKTVTISGFNFTGATSVKFGGVAATSFTVNNSTTITATVGTGASGTLSVTTPSGTGTLAGFTWVAAPGALSYASSPISATYGVAISNASPTVTGTVDSYTISPTLPAGLSFNISTGVISSTATTTSAQTSYTVTAINAGGSTTATVQITVAAKALTITGVTASAKVFDGSATATLSGGTLNGVVSGDASFVTITVGTGAFADKNIGTAKTVTASGYSLGGTKASNYTLTAQPAAMTADITAKPLTITGITATAKIYDGATTATLSGGTLNGVVGSDVVTLTAGTGTFANANIGTAKAVTASGFGISGTGAVNYILSAQPSGLTADITRKTLTVSGSTATNKVYDGNTTAAITGGTLNGIVGSDDVTIANNTTGTFATAAVGTAKTVTSAMTLSGAAASNYSITQPTLTANITARTLTVTGATATNKVYDGNTTASITGATLSGIVGSDVVNLANNTTGTFASSGVGTVIAVTSAMTLSGAAAGNYTLTQPTLTANITVKTLTVTGATATNKVYDGNTSAAITGSTLSGIVGSDIVILANNTTGTFATSAVGTSKAVTTSMTINGAGAGNYTLTQPTLTANITAVTLTVTGATATNKVYDGNTTAAISGGILTGIVGSDDVTLANNTTGTFTTAAVGTAKTVTSAMTLSGTTAGNYTLTQPALSANITTKTLTVTGSTANNKVYDGNTNATISGGALVGVAGSDEVALANNTTGTFASADLGTGIAVTTAMTLSGASAGNYSLTQPTLFADITKRLLTVTGATANNKIYDGNTSATIAGGTLSGVLGADVVTLVNTTTGTFASANAGTSVPVTTSMTIEGADAGLYTIIQPSLTANITPKALTATADNKSKTTGQANPDLTISYSGFITGENASLITEPSVSTTAVTTSPTGTYPITLSGGSAANYAISLVNGVLTVNKAVLTITADNKSKIYGAANPDLSLAYSGFVNGDDASAITPPSASTTATPGSAAGTYPINLTGGSASNYTFTLVEGTMTISKAVLTVTADSKSKEYGSANPDLTLNYSGYVNGDDESALSLKPALVTSANTVSGAGTYSIIPSAAAADNYSFNYVNGTLTVTKKMLTVTAENKIRLVNQPDPEFTMTYIGFAGNDGVASITTLPVASTTAVLSSPAGLYPIIPAGGATENYNFTYLNGSLQISTIAGDINGDGKITPPEITGDSNYDGKIDGTEIAGDANGDGKITPPEIAGDVDGDGKITSPEIAGDTNGDGKIDGTEIAGDTNGDGKIDGTEIAGDVNGDGMINGTEIAGDTNGDGKITGTEIAGDVNGDGIIAGTEIAGDTNGDGKISGTEMAGDVNGDGKITGTEIAGDTNGDGKIDGTEIAGDTNGDGKISGSEIAGDVNGDGKITGTEIAGDTNGDGKISGSEIAGDVNGDGKITGTEIAGDTNGDGKIDGTEIAGDTNGDGKITGTEIAGDTNGDGSISGAEIAGDTNGDGKISGSEIAGDVNGDGKITGTEIAGDTNGDGKVDGTEIAGDTNGDGKISGTEIAGDVNGDGKITGNEIAGDTNGDGIIIGIEIAGDVNGDHKIAATEIAGDTNGDGKIAGTEIAGDTNGDGKIAGTEIAGDTNGDGSISGGEIAGDTNGDGKISGSEIAGDVNGDGKITGTEIAGDTNGDGSISGTELMGDINGDGSIGTGEVSGDSNGDGIIGSGESRVFDPQKDFPNINHLFTPNNDGINDYWILPDLDKYGNSDVKVYNRWGKLVYSNKNYDNLWDGTSDGTKLPDGAYYYIIKTEKAGTISGTVNILR